MPISDKPMAYKEFAAIKSQLVTELKLTPREWLSLLAMNIDSAGAIQNLLSTSGAVTEASASSILTWAQLSADNAAAAAHPAFIGSLAFVSSHAASQQAIPKRFSVTLTATAGGEITSAAVAASITGYKTCMVVTHFWSDQTDGSINLNWATTSGLSYGPATTNIATTASTVTPDWHEGIAWKGSAVTEAINVSAAAGQCGANQVIVVQGYYWGEAT